MKIETINLLKQIIVANQDRLGAIQRRLVALLAELKTADTAEKVSAIEAEFKELKEESAKLVLINRKNNASIQAFFARGHF